LKRLLSELLSDFARKTPILYIDNASAIKLTKNPEYDDIGIEHIDGRKQLAELLTKPIERVRFEIPRREIGITSGEQ